MKPEERLDQIAKDLLTNGGHGELYDIVRLAAAWRDMREKANTPKEKLDKPKWGQDFIKTKGRVLKITASRKAVIYRYVDEKTQHITETSIPLSLIENGETTQPEDQNISVKEWFVKKEELSRFKE